jgi:hypothetical protein
MARIFLRQASASLRQIVCAAFELGAVLAVTMSALPHRGIQIKLKKKWTALESMPYVR